MRIGIWMFGYLPKIGGAQISAHSLANSLTMHGNDVIVYASQNLLDACAERGWNFAYGTRGISNRPFRLGRWLGRPGSWLGGKLLVDKIKSDRLDVVQLVGLWPWAPLLPSIRRASGVPIAIRAAGDDIQVSEELGYGVRRDERSNSQMIAGLSAVDLAVAISETVVEEYSAVGIPREKMTVIPPGVDFQAFQSGESSSDTRTRWGLPEDKKLIISVGRNHSKKGFADLIETLAILNRRRDDYALAIIGDGTRKLESAADSADVKDAFFPISIISGDSDPLTGTFPSNELIDLYRSADVFVLPSYLETYANVALEAMAAGTPAIVTDAPGCRDTVVDGEDGLIVPTGDIQAAADAIQRIENDERLRETIVAGGLKKADTQDWDRIAGEYLSQYERLVANA